MIAHQLPPPIMVSSAQTKVQHQWNSHCFGKMRHSAITSTKKAGVTPAQGDEQVKIARGLSAESAVHCEFYWLMFLLPPAVRSVLKKLITIIHDLLPLDAPSWCTREDRINNVGMDTLPKWDWVFHLHQTIYDEHFKSEYSRPVSAFLVSIHVAQVIRFTPPKAGEINNLGGLVKPTVHPTHPLHPRSQREQYCSCRPSHNTPMSTLLSALALK